MRGRLLRNAGVYNRILVEERASRMSEPKKIAAFSMTPLFPDFAMGGGQVQLKKVALHLGELGHRLTILSTQREGSITPFKWHENVEIRPILRFKQPYPEPYFTPLYHIANAMRYVGDAIADADIHYSHDGGLIFPLVYQAKPTVISLRSIIYPETLQCAFLFQGDEWILPSEHTRASYAAAVSQFAPDVGDRMHTIHNGFDWDVYRYKPPSAIFEVIPAEVADHKVMLFPHRPDTNKGIYEVVQVARRLVHELGWDDLRVLVPRWLDADSDSLNIAYYDQAAADDKRGGLGRCLCLSRLDQRSPYTRVLQPGRCDDVHRQLRRDLRQYAIRVAGLRHASDRFSRRRLSRSAAGGTYRPSRLWRY